MNETKVTAEMLSQVARDLPVDKWRPMCRRLLMNDGDVESTIDKLDHDFKGNADEIKHQMLLCWQRRKGSNATVHCLALSLRACNLVKIAETIEEWDFSVDDGVALEVLNASRRENGV